MKDNKDITSEDYLDSLLNSIMNNDSKSSDSEDDLGLFADSVDKTDELEEDDFLGALEDELFGAIDDPTAELIDEDEYFQKELTDAELFDLDEDIMSIIDDTPSESVTTEKKQIIKDFEPEDKEDVDGIANDEAAKTEEVISVTDVDEAIATNDSAVDDNLQGLLDVMGIDDNAEDLANDIPVKNKKEKKKKKLFGKKKEKAGKIAEEDNEESLSDELVDLSSLDSLMGSVSSDNIVSSEPDELDFSSMDLSSLDNTPSPDINNMSDFDDFDFGLGNDLSEDTNSKASDSFAFDDEFSDDSEFKPKSKKGKKKKEKKAKVKKEKTKKKATPKKKKEKIKKEKEPDEVVKISKAFMVLMFTIIVVFVFSVVFGGDYYTYTKKVSTATKEYVNQNYTVAYDTLFGLEMKKNDDKELFNQIQTVMFVNRHYEAYESLIKMDEYEQGLYSLLKGVKMFDKYQNTGRELNCYDDMQNVLGWINRGLLETYGLTESQARELNLINNDDKLALEVCTIAEEARQKALAEKEAAEEAAKDEANNKKEEE